MVALATSMKPWEPIAGEAHLRSWLRRCDPGAKAYPESFCHCTDDGLGRRVPAILSRAFSAGGSRQKVRQSLAEHDCSIRHITPGARPVEPAGAQACYRTLTLNLDF